MTSLLIFHFVNFTRAAGQIAYTCAFFIWSRTALFLHNARGPVKSLANKD